MLWFKMPKNLKDFNIEIEHLGMVCEMMYFSNSKTGLCSFNASSLMTKYACRLGTYRRVTRSLLTANILRTGKKKGVYYCNFNWDTLPTNCEQPANSLRTDSQLTPTLTLDKNRTDKNRIYMSILDTWNEMANANALSKIKTISPKRKTRINIILKSMPDIKDWRTAIYEIPKNNYLLGSNDRGWKANIDWFLNSNETALKLLEGAEVKTKDDMMQEFLDASLAGE